MKNADIFHLREFSSTGLHRWHSDKNLPANAGDTRDSALMPGLGRVPGGGNGNLLQYSFLGNSLDRGAWQAPGLQRVEHD